MEEQWRALVEVVRSEEMEVGAVLGALGKVGELRGELDRVERRLMGAARESGVSWGDIAQALGLRSRQAAEQRWLRLGQVAGRDAVAARQQRKRQRNADNASGAAVIDLRNAVLALYELLAVSPAESPAIGLASQTLKAALDASPGAMFDLARLAVRDLGELPAGTLGGAVGQAHRRLATLVSTEAGQAILSGEDSPKG